MRALLFTALLFAACGGGAGGSCESVGATVCPKACSCTGGGKCTVLVPSSSGTSSLSFNSASDCQLETNLVCENSQAAKTVDYSACQTALASAACAADPNQAGAMAFNLPAPCAPLY